MEKLHRDSSVYKMDYNDFIAELKQFHQNRGTQFRNIPRINGRDIDLLSLYTNVTALGGWKKVNDTSKWDVVIKKLNLPKGIVNAPIALRHIYIRYLCHYERLHLHGEDPDSAEPSPDTRPSRHTSIVQQVPLTYNMQQHQVTESTRSMVGLCKQFQDATDYDKLSSALRCGLPNEQDFAVNTATILSNEGNRVLRLKDKPQLVTLLLAQAGVWQHGDEMLQSMHQDLWEDLESRDVEAFWRESIDPSSDPDLATITAYLWKHKKPKRRFNSCIYHVQEMGVKNTAGQKILRIVNIFRNLSFEKDNMKVLAENSIFIRFLIQCIFSNWAGLQHAALDTLGNIAGSMNLKSTAFGTDEASSAAILRLILRIVRRGVVQSRDRYWILRSLEILAHLCEQEPNEDVLTSGLDFEVYHKMVSFLTAPDMMLLVYALEALYYLSEMGAAACDKIVSVYKSIGILINLLTFEPSSLGPNALKGMKLVEVMVPSEETELESPAPKPKPSEAVPSSSSQSNDSTPNTESEIFACNWLRENYEACRGFYIGRNDIYAEYVNYCSKAGKKGVVNANDFANCVKSVFQCGLNKFESAVGIINCRYEGLRKKNLTQSTVSYSGVNKQTLTSNIIAKPSPVSLSSQSVIRGLGPPNTAPKSPAKPAPLPKPAAQPSPILKAQLSVPPRPPPAVSPRPPISSSIRPSTPLPPRPQTTSPSPQPNPATSSPLIKSLLANKVARNIQRQQQDSNQTVTSTTVVTTTNVILQQQPSTSHTQTPIRSSASSSVPVITTSPITTAPSPAPVIKKQIAQPPPPPPKPVVNPIPRINGLLQPCDILAQAISQAGIIDDDDSPSTSAAETKPSTPSSTSTASTPLQTAANGGGLLARLIADPKHKITSHNNLLQTMLGGARVEPATKEDHKKMYKSSPLLNGLLDKGKLAEQQHQHHVVQQNGHVKIKVEKEEAPNSSSSCDSIVINHHASANGELPRTIAPAGKAASSTTSDLSSISDIARTLESASKTISKTNMDCVTVPCAQTVIRAGQQVLLVSTPVGQAQLAAAPNTKFWLLYPAPTAKVDADGLINFPRVSIQQSTAAKPLAPATNPIKRTSTVLEQQTQLKRPKVEPSPSPTHPPQIINRTIKVAPALGHPPTIVQHQPPKEVKPTQVALRRTEPPESQTPSALTVATSSTRPFLCEWKNCCRAFKSAAAVLYHASISHTPEEVDELPCAWENCDNMKRKRFSLLTHLQDWHCTEQVLHLQALRRQQLSQTGKTTLPPPPQPPPHPGYTPDAALLAIRRHAAATHNASQETPEKVKEEPLAKSIHLTSALILRNLVFNSSLARSYFKQHESELMQLATLPMEFSKTLSQCLFELTRQGE